MRKKYDWDFFIAHAAADQSIAEQFYELLRPARVFLANRCLVPGDDWDKELLNAQRKSGISLLLISSHTKRAYYQREEIAAAINLARTRGNHHRVVPIFLDSKVRIPYGLRSKHSVTVINGDLAAVVQKLKRALQLRGANKSAAEHTGSRRESRSKLSLADAISRLTLPELVAEVVEPLATVLHPGRIEYGDTPIESARTILSFGQDSLRRPHVLCIYATLVKPSKGHALKKLIDRAGEVKETGVERENGSTCFPDEVWVLTPHQWNQRDRRLVAKSFELLNRKGIKFILGQELCGILIDNLPKVAARLSKYSSPEIVRLISALSKHTEGRAFGFSSDRNIDEFYVTAALSPYAVKTYAALRGEVSVTNAETVIDVPLQDLIKLSEIHLADRILDSLLSERASSFIEWGALAEYEIGVDFKPEETVAEIRANCIKYCLFGFYDFRNAAGFIRKLRSKRTSLSKYLYDSFSEGTRWRIDNWDASSQPSGGLLEILSDDLNDLIKREDLYSIERFRRVKFSVETKEMLERKGEGTHRVVLNRLLLQDAYRKEVSPNEYLNGETLSFDVTLKLEPAFERLVRATKQALKRCPNELKRDVSAVKNAWTLIERTERFLEAVLLQLGLEEDDRSQRELFSRNVSRIRVPNPEHLLTLEKVILVEGPPGCGKTTLLRTLAVKLLTENRGIYYLPCSTVTRDFKKADLRSVLQTFAQGSKAAVSREKDGVLIIDGLDEASFDMSDLVFSAAKQFSNIVVSSRASFDTTVRRNAFRVVLSPFTDRERDLFFEKWFRNDAQLISQVSSLIRDYPDIDLHTRLPLIATITVALLLNGIVPKTRAEIYAYRLELLLSKWDHFRGVKRLYIDNPDAKRRFLRELAYWLHAARGRRRHVALNELVSIYERSLGAWGYNIDYRQLLNDLVVGSGVLIEEPAGYYSLGHLTFQEHLAAEYMVEKLSLDAVAKLVGDDWWHEPLNFYASIRGDITLLVNYMMGSVGHLAHVKQLAEMAVHAPYTSPGAIQCITESLRPLRETELDDDKTPQSLDEEDLDAWELL